MVLHIAVFLMCESRNIFNLFFSLARNCADQVGDKSISIRKRCVIATISWFKVEKKNVRKHEPKDKRHCARFACATPGYNREIRAFECKCNENRRYILSDEDNRRAQPWDLRAVCLPQIYFCAKTVLSGCGSIRHRMRINTRRNPRVVIFAVIYHYHLSHSAIFSFEKYRLSFPFGNV